MSRDFPLETTDSPKKKRSHERKAKKRKHVDVSSDLEDLTSSKKSKHSHADTPRNSQSSRESVDSSPFYVQQASLYVPLPPIALHYATLGLCSEVLSSLVLRYFLPLQGVVVAYTNVKISEDTDQAAEGPSLARSVDEYSDPFIWTTADFLVFRPRTGDRVEGVINLQSEGHIGLICFHFFNAKIARSQMMTSWRWVEPVLKSKKSKARLKRDGASGATVQQQQTTKFLQGVDQDADYQGHYESEDGTVLSGKISFTVRDIEASTSTEREKSYLMIEGMIPETSVQEDSSESLANGSLTGTATRKRRRIKAEVIEE